MAVTNGHGNSRWTKDEEILALDLYLSCDGDIPPPSDYRIKELSDLLQAFPHTGVVSRNSTFRNPAGVAFKLQNLHHVATGEGLGNVSALDCQVWKEFGGDVQKTREVADLIRLGIELIKNPDLSLLGDHVFVEGRVITEMHLRRERDPKLRKQLLAQRRRGGGLCCEICEFDSSVYPEHLDEAMFEAHHIIPLSLGSVRKTEIHDLALLCANCHRLIHKVIAQNGRWLSIAEARSEIFGG